MNSFVKAETKYLEDAHMLILSRHIGEQIIAGEQGEIRIVLVGFEKDGQARIGVVAPSSVPISRKEIYDKMQKEKQNNKKIT